MNTAARPWLGFVADMNGDGSITIRDVLLWLKHAYFLPGDSLLWFLDAYLRPVAHFLEVSRADYQGFFSGFTSAIVWFVVLVLIGIVHDRTVRLMLAIKMRSRALSAEVIRRIRVTRNRWRGKLWL